ncbi:hypothetical protein SASPL_121416 [Salvia splendens]|uniref:O-fucosyltransferase family protein n=1 Tax=Salvia splendens TaxID=180675 RepID=A0A8X8XSC9_SALSN|nr:hypothetical protein SASPL_121416 [Salvia splendens]
MSYSNSTEINIVDGGDEDRGNDFGFGQWIFDRNSISSRMSQSSPRDSSGSPSSSANGYFDFKKTKVSKRKAWYLNRTTIGLGILVGLFFLMNFGCLDGSKNRVGHLQSIELDVHRSAKDAFIIGNSVEKEMLWLHSWLYQEEELQKLGRGEKPQKTIYARLLAKAAHALAEGETKEPKDLWMEPYTRASSWIPCSQTRNWEPSDDVRKYRLTMLPRLMSSCLCQRVQSGFIMVTANGGINQQRVAVCNAVAIARMLNATLVLPRFMFSSVWRDASGFESVSRKLGFKEIRVSAAARSTIPTLLFRHCSTLPKLFFVLLYRATLPKLGFTVLLLYSAQIWLLFFSAKIRVSATAALLCPTDALPKLVAIVVLQLLLCYICYYNPASATSATVATTALQLLLCYICYYYYYPASATSATVATTALQPDIRVVKELPLELQSLDLEAMGSMVTDSDITKEAKPNWHLIQSLISYRFVPKIQEAGALLLQRMRQNDTGLGHLDHYLVGPFAQTTLILYVNLVEVKRKNVNWRLTEEYISLHWWNWKKGKAIVVLRDKGEIVIWLCIELYPSPCLKHGSFLTILGSDFMVIDMSLFPSPTELKSEGLCPLMPEETVLMLAGLGFNRRTHIYLAGAHIYGGNSRLNRLLAGPVRYSLSEQLKSLRAFVTASLNSKICVASGAKLNQSGFTLTITPLGGRHRLQVGTCPPVPILFLSDQYGRCHKKVRKYESRLGHIKQNCFAWKKKLKAESHKEEGHSSSH